MGKGLNLFIFFFILILYPANADTYQVQCIYEKGKKIITIDEKNKKITNSPALFGPRNYRKTSEYIYVYENAALQEKRIDRTIIDLENLEEETIFLTVSNKIIEDIKMLLPKFDRGEISYDEIDKAKREGFDKFFKDPKSTKNKVVKNWRNDWEGGHPEEYIMYENNSDLSYQVSMIHRCNFIN